VARGVHGKEGKGATVPVFSSDTAVGVALILNVKTVAGGAKVGAGGAADTAHRNLFPEFALKVGGVLQPGNTGVDVELFMHFGDWQGRFVALPDVFGDEREGFTSTVGQLFNHPSPVVVEGTKLHVRAFGAVGALFE